MQVIAEITPTFFLGDIMQIALCSGIMQIFSQIDVDI